MTESGINCIKCGYNMRLLNEQVCPECGWIYDQAAYDKYIMQQSPFHQLKTLLQAVCMAVIIPFSLFYPAGSFIQFMIELAEFRDNALIRVPIRFKMYASPSWILDHLRYHENGFVAETRFVYTVLIFATLFLHIPWFRSKCTAVARDFVFISICMSLVYYLVMFQPLATY